MSISIANSQAALELIVKLSNSAGPGLTELQSQIRALNEDWQSMSPEGEAAMRRIMAATDAASTDSGTKAELVEANWVKSLTGVQGQAERAAAALRQLGEEHPQLNVEAMQAQAADLIATIERLKGESPVTLEARIEKTQAETQLTELRQEIAQTKAEAAEMGESAGGGLDGIQGGALRAFGALSLVQMGLGYVGQGLDATYGKSVQFEDAMVRLQNNTGMLDSQTRDAAQSIMGLFETSRSSLESLQAAYQNVANMGYRGADATTVLDEAMKSASSTGGDLAATADVLARTLHAYGYEADQTAQVMNTLHTAQLSADASFEQFAGNSARAIGTAAQLNVPLDQVAAALAALTRNGWDSSSAQNQLVSALTHLIKPSQEASAELERLQQITGIPLQDDFTPQGLAAKGLTGVIADLRQAYQDMGLSEEEATGETMKLLNAQRGGLGMAALVTNAYNDYTGTLDSITRANETGSAAQLAFARSMGTTAGQTDELKNKWDAFLQSVGNSKGTTELFRGMNQQFAQIAAFLTTDGDLATRAAAAGKAWTDEMERQASLTRQAAAGEVAAYDGIFKAREDYLQKLRDQEQQAQAQMRATMTNGGFDGVFNSHDSAMAAEAEAAKQHAQLIYQGFIDQATDALKTGNGKIDAAIHDLLSQGKWEEAAQLAAQGGKQVSTSALKALEDTVKQGATQYNQATQDELASLFSGVGKALPKIDASGFIKGFETNLLSAVQSARPDVYASIKSLIDSGNTGQALTAAMGALGAKSVDEFVHKLENESQTMSPEAKAALDRFVQDIQSSVQGFDFAAQVSAHAGTERGESSAVTQAENVARDIYQRFLTTAAQTLSSGQPALEQQIRDLMAAGKFQDALALAEANGNKLGVGAVSAALKGAKAEADKDGGLPSQIFSGLAAGASAAVPKIDAAGWINQFDQQLLSQIQATDPVRYQAIAGMLSRGDIEGALRAAAAALGASGINSFANSSLNAIAQLPPEIAGQLGDVYNQIRGYSDQWGDLTGTSYIDNLINGISGNEPGVQAILKWLVENQGPNSKILWEALGASNAEAYALTLATDIDAANLRIATYLQQQAKEFTNKDGGWRAQAADALNKEANSLITNALGDFESMIPDLKKAGMLPQEPKAAKASKGPKPPTDSQIAGWEDDVIAELRQAADKVGPEAKSAADAILQLLKIDDIKQIPQGLQGVVGEIRTTLRSLSEGADIGPKEMHDKIVYWLQEIEKSGADYRQKLSAEAALDEIDQQWANAADKLAADADKYAAALRRAENSAADAMGGLGQDLLKPDNSTADDWSKLLDLWDAAQKSKLPPIIDFAQSELDKFQSGASVTGQQLYDDMMGAWQKLAQDSDPYVAALGQSWLAKLKDTQQQAAEQARQTTEQAADSVSGSVESLFKDLLDPNRNVGVMLQEMISIGEQATAAGWPQIAATFQQYGQQIASGGQVDFNAVQQSLLSALDTMLSSSDPKLQALGLKLKGEEGQWVADAQETARQLQESFLGGLDTLSSDLTAQKADIPQTIQDLYASADQAAKAGDGQVAATLRSAGDLLSASGASAWGQAMSAVEGVLADGTLVTDNLTKALIAKAKGDLDAGKAQLADAGRQAAEAAMQAISSLQVSMAAPGGESAGTLQGIFDLANKLKAMGLDSEYQKLIQDAGDAEHGVAGAWGQLNADLARIDSEVYANAGARRDAYLQDTQDKIAQAKQQMQQAADGLASSLGSLGKDLLDPTKSYLSDLEGLPALAKSAVDAGMPEIAQEIQQFLSNGGAAGGEALYENVIRWLQQLAQNGDPILRIFAQEAEQQLQFQEVLRQDQAEVDRWAAAVGRAQDVVSRYQEQLSTAQANLQKFTQAKLQGEGAFDDKEFANQQQQYQLQLKIAELQAKGPGYGGQIAFLQEQLQQLQSQGNVLQLQSHLQFDGEHRAIDQAANPRQEMSYQDALAGAQRARDEIDRYTPLLSGAQKQLKSMQDAQKLAQQALQAATLAFQQQSTALGPWAGSWQSASGQIGTATQGMKTDFGLVFGSDTQQGTILNMLFSQDQTGFFTQLDSRTSLALNWDRNEVWKNFGVSLRADMQAEFGKLAKVTGDGAYEAGLAIARGLENSRSQIQKAVQNILDDLAPLKSGAGSGGAGSTAVDYLRYSGGM